MAGVTVPAKLWKIELQRFADETGLEIHVCHFPPGTSKWNKIEHRLFSHISHNWRGKPLVSHEIIVNLIAGTTTSKGLKVPGQFGTSGISWNWNYVVLPKSQPTS